jgi:predicted RNase H-like HicB family nuclease
MKRDFTLEYWMDEGWYVGRLREVPGVFSQGETLDELIANVQEVYHLMLEDAMPPVTSETKTMEVGIEA